MHLRVMRKDDEGTRKHYACKQSCDNLRSRRLLGHLLVNYPGIGNELFTALDVAISACIRPESNKGHFFWTPWAIQRDIEPRAVDTLLPEVGRFHRGEHLTSNRDLFNLRHLPLSVVVRDVEPEDFPGEFGALRNLRRCHVHRKQLNPALLSYPWLSGHITEEGGLIANQMLNI